MIGGSDNEIEKTNINNIYALGDVFDGCPEYYYYIIWLHYINMYIYIYIKD